jgi:hypothetical protein
MAALVAVTFLLKSSILQIRSEKNFGFDVSAEAAVL